MFAAPRVDEEQRQSGQRKDDAVVTF